MGGAGKVKRGKKINLQLVKPFSGQFIGYSGLE